MENGLLGYVDFMNCRVEKKKIKRYNDTRTDVRLTGKV